MNANQADAKVATMCRVLAVSTSGYYARRGRAPSTTNLDYSALVKALELMANHTVAPD